MPANGRGFGVFFGGSVAVDCDVSVAGAVGDVPIETAGCVAFRADHLRWIAARILPGTRLSVRGG